MRDDLRGSELEMLKIGEENPWVIFDLVKEKMKSYNVEFSDSDKYWPNSSTHNEKTAENYLTECGVMYPHADIKKIKNWWADVDQSPNWDFISSCTIKEKRGVLIVEAKSHEKEVDTGGKRLVITFPRSEFNDDLVKEAKISLTGIIVDIDEDKDIVIIKFKAEQLSELMCWLHNNSLMNCETYGRFVEKMMNHDKIGDAISEAKGALSNFIEGISISRDFHYQLSNRIAYTWKLASIGIPTILLYLGFLNDPAWVADGDHFENKNSWSEFIGDNFSMVGARGLLEKKEIVLPNGVPAYFIEGSVECIQVSNRSIV